MEKNFECSVKYRKTLETGVQKVVTEPYIVQGVNFTEAEANIIAKMTENISGDFRITNIKAVNYQELVLSEAIYKFFKVKVALIAYDEESGKEKATNIYLLVEADDAKEAYDLTVNDMKRSMGDYKISSVSETKIVEVFPYKESASTPNEN